MSNETLEGYHLSPQQQRLWQLRQDNACRWQYGVWLEGPCDVPTLAAALGQVVERHEILRTVFHSAGDPGLTLQVVTDVVEVGLREEDLSGLSPAEQESALVERWRGEQSRGFDYRRGPLVHATLLKFSAARRLLVLSVAAICADALTLQNLSAELREQYAALLGEGTQDPDEPAQYADYAAWLNELLEVSEPHEAHAYWGASVEVAPVRLPLEKESKADESGAIERRRLQLDGELSARIEALAKKVQAEVSDVLLAAWATLLWRLTGERDVSVEVCFDGRKYDYLRPALGCFAQYLPVLCRFEDYRFDEVVELVRDAVASAHTRQEYYGAEAHARRDKAAPAGGIGFDYRERAGETRAGGLRLSEWRIEGRGERLKLRLSAEERGEGGLELAVECAAGLYGAGEAERLCERFVALLRGAVSGAGAAASSLPALGERERQQVLHEWNETAEPFPAHATLHSLFEQQAAAKPDAVALISETESLTFAELNARANRLASYLVALGVGPEMLVGVLMERSTELVVSLLAVLKAGAAYLPLDPNSPRERLAFMLEDAAAPVLLTQGRLLDAAPTYWGQIFCVDEQWDEVEGLSEENPRPETDPTNLAYVIYTSGSTGQPKGVCVEHRGLVNYLWWSLSRYPVAAGAGAPLHSGVAFDLSVTTLYAPLLAGRAVRLLPVGEELTGLAEAWRRHAADPLSFVKLTPAHLRLLAAQLGADASPAGALALVVGGENLLEEEVEFWRRRAPQVSLFNEYGPTEAVVGCCVYEASAASSGGVSAPIGRAAANTRLYVLDGGMGPAPVGVAGELYIGGVQLGRGYLGRAALTAERFVPDPHSGEEGARLYRTGDVARYLGDGNLEFLGRSDEQVKVRGYRVELGEVETVLVGHERVRECAVVAREDTPGDKRLVAYVVGPDAGEKVGDELRSYLGERLPEYMSPSSYVVLESFPLTPSGKVDRRSLPAPEYTRDELAHEYVAPRTPTEQLLAEVWAEILSLPRVGIHDNFFELGGHSLLAMRLVSRVREVFKVELSLRALFDSATVAGLGEVIEAESRAERGLALAPIGPVDRGGEAPLSFAQQRLWFLDQLEPNSAAYNLSSAVLLRGRLNVAALEQTLSEIVRRHESLRTTFAERDGQPVQVIREPAPLKLEVEDLSVSAEPEAQARRLAEEEARRPFDLAAGPLLRVRLLRLSEEEHVLSLTMHHIVSDGWSVGVLVKEVAALYTAYDEGRESPLAELPIQYADFAAWQREHLAGEALERQLGYWRGQLGGGLPTLELPTDRPRPAVQRMAGAVEHAEMGGVGEALRELSRREGTTLFMTLLAAWQVLLARYTEQDDIVVGTPVAGRGRAEVENLIGFFVNTLVLRTDLSDNPTFRELLARVREVCLGAYAHPDVPFEKLVEELQPERDLSRSPLFQVMFDIQHSSAERFELRELSLTPLEAGDETSKFDLSLTFGEKGGRLEAAFVYSTDLFEADTIRRMGRHLRTLLESIAAAPDRRVSDLALLDEDERREVLAVGAGARAEYPTHLCLHELFERQAAATPDAAALEADGQRLSYGELNAGANRLAHFLRELGVKPGGRVGLLMERGAAFVVGLFGILKAGGVYVPLEPTHPAERLAFMLADSGAEVVLTRRDYAAALKGEGLKVVCVEERADEIARACEENPRRAAGPEDLAYLIYTSGSTGRPKAVMVEHRQLVNTIMTSREVFDFGPSDVMPVLASFSFDISLFELLTPLLAGGRAVVLGGAQVLDLAGLAGSLEGMTRLHAVPSLMRQIVEAARARGAGGGYAGLRQLFVGGDSVPPELLKQMAETFPQSAVTVLYGPTETTIICTSYRAGKTEAAGRRLIGRPLNNVELRINDRHGRPAPFGVTGELYIGGAGVARGYLGREELNAEKFVTLEGARYYRSGDRGRYLPGGDIEFLGRGDEQVKVRGYRIEVGEIEAALAAHPEVSEAVVLARNAGADEKRLVAYVVAAPGQNGGAAALSSRLREHLGQRLPEYMLPSNVVFLDALPLNPNGKVNRRALPEPEYTRDGLAEEYVAPRTPAEERLAGIWAEVLGLPRVGVRDSFFDLGGHSLLATQLVSKIRQAFGPEVTLRSLFESPTVEQFARLVGPGGTPAGGDEELENVPALLPFSREAHRVKRNAKNAQASE